MNQGIETENKMRLALVVGNNYGMVHAIRGLKALVGNKLVRAADGCGACRANARNGFGFGGKYAANALGCNDRRPS